MTVLALPLKGDAGVLQGMAGQKNSEILPLMQERQNGRIGGLFRLKIALNEISKPSKEKEGITEHGMWDSSPPHTHT